MRPLLLATVLLIPASLISADGFAQTQDDDRARMSEAVAEFDARRFAEARALFRRAHGLSPSARTLRGIGRTSFELGDYVEAHRALSASLTDPRRPLTDEQRAVVSEILSKAVLLGGLYTGGQGTAREPVAGHDEPLAATASAPDEETLDLFNVAGGLLMFGGAPSFLVAILAGTAWRIEDSSLRSCDERGDACLDRDDRVASWEAAAITTVTSASILLVSTVAAIILLTIRADDGPDDGGEGDAELGCAPFGLGVGCVGRF